MVPVLLGVATLVFLLLHLIPNDAVLDRLLGETAPQEQREALRHDLGLDRPLFEQYLVYLKDLLRGDLGRSLEHDRPVTALIRERFPATLLLAVTAALVAVAVALPAGMAAAWAFRCARRQRPPWKSPPTRRCAPRAPTAAVSRSGT